MSEERARRLRTLIYSIQTEDPFNVDWAKHQCQCHDISPGYVTRVIRQLARAGHLAERKEQRKTLYQWRRDPAHPVDTWIDAQVFGDQVKQTPLSDRPREHLLSEGPAKLSVAQLIAILIRVGVTGESAVQAGSRVANRFADQELARLCEASLPELKAISKAIRKDSYCQVMAGIELGRRIAAIRDDPASVPERIRGSEDAITYCMQRFARLAFDGKQEEFHIVTLDTQHGPINNHRITVGTLDASLVHPREVFRPAIRDSASAILLVHNHPSGDPTPSREDHAVTDRLTKVGELIGIRILDHIIVSKQRGLSIMADR